MTLLAAVTVLMGVLTPWITRLYVNGSPIVRICPVMRDAAVPDAMMSELRPTEELIRQDPSCGGETASMPVTVSNKLPYPISVRVSSLTDSMEIVTSRLSDVEVAPNSEAQTSAASSVTANVTILLSCSSALSALSVRTMCGTSTALKMPCT